MAKDSPEHQPSRQQLRHDIAMHIGQAEIAALEAIGQLGVVEAEQVQDRGVEVVDVDFVGGRVEAELVGLAESCSRFHAAAGQPHAETIRVMVAAVVASLDHRSAAELAAPNDQRVVEQAPLFEVAQQRGGGFVGCSALLFESADESAVMVPRFMEELHAADAALDQSPSQQAVVGETRLARFRAVHLQDVLGFVGDVHQFRRAGLHLGGHLEGADSRGDLRVADHAEPQFVQLPQRVERFAVRLRVNAARVVEKQHRFARRPEQHAVVDRRQKAVAPVRLPAARPLLAG